MSITILTNHSLLPYNTFGIEAQAAYFSTLHHVEEIKEIIEHQKLLKKPLFILGGGSNILCTQDLDAWVIYNQMKGVKILQEDAQSVWVEVGAGEVWHEWVLYAIEKGWSGIENLSLIPGTVGAAPMQNIGAYGVEVKDCIASVHFYDFEQQKMRQLDKNDCHFDYRTSIFKTTLKNKIIITSVVFQLSKCPVLHLDYGAIRQELSDKNIEHPSIQDVSNAVIRIRQSKLPDPKVIGNAGSFFKNPIISSAHFLDLQSKYPNIPHYLINEKMVKVPAGWLIEQAGWKGYREKDFGVHQKQALVLVNYGKASGKEIYQLSNDIIQSIQNKFSIVLEREVNII